MENVNTFNGEMITIEQNKSQRQYRLMGVMMFCVACSLLVARTLTYIIARYLPVPDLVYEIFFSVLSQICFLFVMPLLFYIFIFKYDKKEILKISSIRKTKPVNYLLAVLIGVTCIFVTMGISTFWQNLISILGYSSGGSSSDLPEKFSAGYFFLMLFLTAILPGICEEFTMRGGYLTTMRKSFGYVTTLIIMAISFGLFHQQITQVFYTSFFGLFMAALTLRCRSIFPAMIVHFVNNGMGEYLSHASAYGWVGGGVYEWIYYMLNNNPAGLFFVYMGICVLLTGLIVLFWRLNGDKKKTDVKTVPDIFEYGYNNGTAQTQTTVNDTAADESDENLGVEQIKPELVFKPQLKDNAFYIGAIVIAVFTTIATFVFGWIV